ncbi:hypothetical protein GCM10009839_81730 [Catenulispora yoronensis]|uniref:DUF1015 domain-containing protein n=1 Tax=Catenulispora yoronensis TaxID=450799 RepID=A0ABN2VCH8_9ACTN
MLPFRGLRFVPERVGDPSAVTSPPYDMIGPEEARRLADTAEHNVVRLILAAPEEAAAGPGAPADGRPARYRRAASSLREWMDDGSLRLDPEPGFYVYEQTGAGFRQRGLIALVRLDDADTGSDAESDAAEPAPGRRAILPHEAVTDSVVADRLAQMRATDAHIEPILLTYEGDRTVSDLVDRVANHSEPVTATTTADGTEHRLWAVTDPVTVDRISADLLWHRALIADGHHRHAAYRRLRAERAGQAEAAGTGAGSGTGTRSDTSSDTDTDNSSSTGTDSGTGSGTGTVTTAAYTGPAAYGLALIVDSARYPLSLHAIHRVLPHVPLAVAVEQAGKVFAVRETADPHTVLEGIPASEHAFVLSDGTTHHLLTAPDPAVLARAVPADRPAAWRALDATVLHHVLVESVWHLPDTPEEVRFDHDPEHAIAEAARLGGTAVLLRPTTEEVVRELAGAGVLMPRKSTAFGPKPASGLVMRLLQETAGENRWP